jgi:hypothetical protein
MHFAESLSSCHFHKKKTLTVSAHACLRPVRFSVLWRLPLLRIALACVCSCVTRLSLSKPDASLDTFTLLRKAPP